MPPKVKAPSASKKKSKSPKRNKDESKEDKTSDLFSNLAITGPPLPEYVSWQNQYMFPFIIKTTDFVHGAKNCIINLHIVSVHKTNMVVDVVYDGQCLSVACELPPSFVLTDHIVGEYVVQGDHDTRVSSHRQIASKMVEAHQGHLMVSCPVQLIRLPFQCETRYFKEVVWNAGNLLVYNELNNEGHPSAQQMMPVLCVTCTSIEKDLTQNE